MRKQPNHWLIFTSLAFQMGILFYGAVEIGSYCDQRFNSHNRCTLFACLGALGISLILIIKQSKRL